MKAAIVFGTLTGNTEDVVERVRTGLGFDFELPMIDACGIQAKDLEGYELLILACPTWDDGELVGSWDDIFEEFEDIDLTGTKVVFIGLGDQVDYPETYLDGIGIMYLKCLERGAVGELGFTSTDGHEYDESKAEIDGKFCGLALDEDNQSDETDGRIGSWCAQLRRELGL